jgi:hypothetical protein
MKIKLDGELEKEREIMRGKRKAAGLNPPLQFPGDLLPLDAHFPAYVWSRLLTD